MMKAPASPSILGLSSGYSLGRLALLVIMAAFFSMKVMCNRFDTIEESVKAPETVHSIIGYNAEEAILEGRARSSEKLSIDHKIGSELTKSYESRPLEHAVSGGPESIEPVKSPAKILDNSAFATGRSSELQNELRMKEVEDLPVLLMQLRINPHLSDEALALKDQYLDAFYQINRVIDYQESESKKIALDTSTYRDQEHALSANLKALILTKMLTEDPKEVRNLIDTLSRLPEENLQEGGGGFNWLKIVNAAQQEYPRLSAQNKHNLIEEFFKRVLHSSKWRDARMHQDFYRIRTKHFQGPRGPRQNMILKIEELEEYDFKIFPEDQSLIHKIATAGELVHLTDSDLDRLQGLEQRVKEKVQQVFELQKTPYSHVTQRLTATGYPILKSRSPTEMSPEKKILLEKLESFSARDFEVVRDSSNLNPSQVTPSESVLLQEYQAEYNAQLAVLQRYSKPRALQIEEISLDSKFGETRNRAVEVLERFSEEGIATREQTRLLSELKAEKKIDIMGIKAEEVPELAEAFWERQVNLVLWGKAQWIVNLITEELRKEFLIEPSHLHWIQNITPQTRLDHLRKSQIEHLANFHDELISSMSKEERAFEEILSRELDWHQRLGHYQQLTPKRGGGMTKAFLPDIGSQKSFFKSRMQDRFREVSYARLHWNPTKEDRALELLKALQDKRMPLSKQQSEILEKLENKKPLSDAERGIIKQWAVDSVLWHELIVPDELKNRALKLVHESTLGDLGDYDLILFQNLRDEEIRQLARIHSLSENNEEFEQYSKLSRIFQILKRANERQLLNMSPDEAHLVYFIGKVEMRIRKAQLVHLQKIQNILKSDLKELVELRDSFSKYLLP